MGVLLIAYDLKTPGQKYEQLWAAIRRYPHTKLQESLWAISTMKIPCDVQRELGAFLDANDLLMVIDMRTWCGTGKMPEQPMSRLKELVALA